MSVVDAYSNLKQKVAGTIDDGFDYVSPYFLTLNKITNEDNFYYVKCKEICDAFMKNNYNMTPPIVHDEETHENKWDSILSNAEKCQEPLYNFLDTMVESIKSFYTENNSQQNMKTEVAKASLKKHERAKQKVETFYDGNWRRLCDVCRSSIVHDKFEDLYYILLILYKNRLNCFGFQIVKIKNRYQSPTDQGWADVTLLIQPTANKNAQCEPMDQFLSVPEKQIDEKQIEEKQIDEKQIDVQRIKQCLDCFNMSEYVDNSLPKHVCEVQLIHGAMWEKRKHGVFGHKAYGVFRSMDAAAVKMGDKIGHGDTVNEMIDFRVHIMGGLGKKIFVRDDVNETAGNIWSNVVDQLGDEMEYVYDRVKDDKSKEEIVDKNAEEIENFDIGIEKGQENDVLIPKESSSDPLKEDNSSAQLRIAYGTVGLCGLLAPEIAAVVIAQQYNASICYENNDMYTIPLGLWLNIGGGIALGITIFYFLFGYIYCLFMSKAIQDKVDNVYMNTYLEHLCCHFCISLFHYAWAIIGIYMYANQMSDECQSDMIGQMVIGFAIVNPLQICCAMCCRFSCVAQFKQAVFF
eukprot:61866_1